MPKAIASESKTLFAIASGKHRAATRWPSDDYFRVRDFEFVQPLYDLAFLLEIDALSRRVDIPKYRIFSFWKAAYSLDGYGTTVDRWLDGSALNEELDYVPTFRIKQYLLNIKRTGTVPELDAYSGEQFQRSRRLRSIRGLGPSAIAQSLSSDVMEEDWLRELGANIDFARARVSELYRSPNVGPWQSAHIVPPLFRFMKAVENSMEKPLRWGISGISDPFMPVDKPIEVFVTLDGNGVAVFLEQALKTELQFHQEAQTLGHAIRVVHQMGWSFTVSPGRGRKANKSISELVKLLDPLSANLNGDLTSDLHLHTAWSDGSASVNTMATAVVKSGLQFFAVTDHSRSAKLQGGLTPILWLRQANALSLARPTCPVLHGIEVDILKDGSLDLPLSLLAAADIVVASVHSNWTADARANTDRLLRAIESGHIDVIAHPTSAVIGKMGIPDYVRAAAEVEWPEVFERCSQWGVALEFNCFPSRLDLSIPMLRQAVGAGCAVSVGSDAHARSHLLNLRFGQAVLDQVDASVVLNRLSYAELKAYIQASRERRIGLTRKFANQTQTQLPFDTDVIATEESMICHIQPPRNIPSGSSIVGIDLTAGEKASGIAYLEGFEVKTCSLTSDDEIVSYIKTVSPKIVSIDSPLGLPGGGVEIDPAAGIVRVAERDLGSIGISAYPALIDSMKKLTLRGIRLKNILEALPNAPAVIESYPGAAQDILCIPRKQKSLSLLREGLGRLGLKGSGLDTQSHDEMDAITSAIVGRYFEAGLFEPMGIPSEAQLIVPKAPPLQFENNPIICLSGKTGAGKSVVARYLSVFFGFEWVRTRDVIKELLVQDAGRPSMERLSPQSFDPANISEHDLRDFGAVILSKYKQAPLRQALAGILTRSRNAIIVDSIRDVIDIEAEIRHKRPVQIWFVDSNDRVIQERLLSRTKLGQKRTLASTPVDQNVNSIRMQAHKIIANNSSLEDLRWGIDDALFSTLRIDH